MKVSDLDPKEIEYICTLDWDPLMTYLEKKYGEKFKDEFVNHIVKRMHKGIDETDKKWRN